MNLVDILARELRSWPEGVEFIDQSNVDGQLYFDDLDQKIFLAIPEGSKGIFEFGGVRVCRKEFESAKNSSLNSPALYAQRVGRCFRALSSSPEDVSRAHISNLIWSAMSEAGDAPSVDQVNAAALSLINAGYRKFEIIDERKP